MYKYEQIITKLYAEKHPLADGMDASEVFPLVTNLRNRLNLSDSELDLSPDSLSLLSSTLTNYFNNSDKNLSDIENVKIIREIVAYMVEVFRKNRNSILESYGGLLDIRVTTNQQIKGVKGKDVRTYRKSSTNIGHFASSYWDALNLGINRDLSDYYKLLTSKRVKESL